MITKWNFQTPTEEELHKRDRLASQLGLSPVVCLLLVQRGLTTVEEVKKFFKPSLNDLHDPFLMPDMEKAVKRLNKALGNKEKILIYGDYDVDGTTAVSLVYKYLRPYSSALDYYIPDRYDEGYGISYKGINYARENGITLVISLDCGIKAIEKIEYAKQLGIDFIICDHHMPDDTLPDAGQTGCQAPRKPLSGWRSSSVGPLLRSGIVHALGVHPDGADHLLDLGPVIAHAARDPGDVLGRGHALQQAAEGGILAVQIPGLAHHDEELAASGIGMHGPGHGENAQLVVDVFLLPAVVGELALDAVAGAAHAGALGAAALDHEAGDDPVEIKAVIEAGVGKGDEVIHGVGGLLGVQLTGHDGAAFHSDGDDGMFHFRHIHRFLSLRVRSISRRASRWAAAARLS